MVTIIIVSYNVKELLLSCIGSIRKTFPAGSEIIVIDNNSTDDSVSSVASAFPDVILIRNNFNAGFSGANNQGIKLAKGEFIFFLNPDAEIKEVNLEAWKKISLENNAIVAPVLLNSDGSYQPSAWKFPSGWSVFLESIFLSRLFKPLEYPEIKNSREVDFVSGAAMFFSRNTLNEIGGFDPDLFWMEDTDLCYRHRKNGGMVWVDGLSKVIHHSGQSSRKDYRIPVANQLISKLKFFKKHGLYFSCFFGAAFTLVHIKLRIVLFGLKKLSGTAGDNRFIAYLFAFRKFFRYFFLGDKRIT